jgi:hypothetical protein
MQRFTVVYPDKSRQKVSAARRDELIAAGLVRKDGESYRYTGEAKTLHSLSDLAQLAPEASWDGRRYLPGQFIVESGRKRFFERLETPEGLALRIS